MAHGYPDWWNMQIPAMGIYGEGQTNWMVAEDGDIPGPDSADLADYKVLAGYELHIMAGAVGCDFPGISKFEVLLNGDPLGVGYFDTENVLPLHPAAAYIIPAGLTISFRVHNADTIEHHFSFAALGFLVRLG